MATGDDAVRATGYEVRRLDPAELCWSTSAELQPGDRVRVSASGELGTLGFVNSDHAPMALCNDRQRPRFICGRNVGGTQCGGTDRAGASCRACRRFLAEHAELMSGLRTPHVHHVTLDGDADDRHRLLLTHEIEKAAPLSGVHVEVRNP